MPKAKESHQLLHYRKKVSSWPGRLLATWTRDSTQSQGQSPEHPVWEKLTFHIPSHPTIYIPLYPRFWKSFQREFWERNPREKQNWLIHNLYLRDSSNSSTLFLSIVKSLKGLLPKPFSHHIHFCERAVWCFGKQLGRNQFHIGWCYGQVAESGKLEKK